MPSGSRGQSVLVVSDTSHDQTLTVVIEVRPIGQIAITPVPVMSVGSQLRVPLLLFDVLGRQFSSGPDVHLDFKFSVESSSGLAHSG